MYLLIEAAVMILNTRERWKDWMEREWFSKFVEWKLLMVKKDDTGTVSSGK